METPETALTSVRRGSQAIDASSIQIELPLPSTVVSKNVHPDTGCVYTVNISSNQVVNSLLIYVTGSVELLNVAMGAWGELEPDLHGAAEELLAACFSGLNISFLANRSDPPDRIGAVLMSEGSHVLISIDVAGAAIGFQLAKEELSKSIKVQTAHAR